MRKSERIRQLELQMVRLQMEVEILNTIISNMFSPNEEKILPTDLDSGKWYNRKSD
jgi:hypothetical protein